MENKKLLSVRLDPQTIAKINVIQQKHYYWKRGTIISSILDAVVDNFDDKAIYDMMRYIRRFDKHVSCSFSLDD